MITEVYLHRETRVIWLGPPPPGDWLLLGHVGDGQDGHPIGLRPANLCPTCGQLRVLTPGGYTACPAGHTQLAPNPAWGGDQSLLFASETTLPLPVVVHSRHPVVPNTPRFDVVCEIVSVRHRKSAHPIVATDVLLQLPENASVLWWAPEPYHGSNVTVRLDKDNEDNCLRRAVIVFRNTPPEPLPEEGAAFGTLQVCLPGLVRVDWTPAGHKITNRKD